jgi:hypothetical protein
VNILRGQGFAESQIYEINDTRAGARMLALRRFDAWYGSRATAAAINSRL